VILYQKPFNTLSLAVIKFSINLHIKHIMFRELTRARPKQWTKSQK